MNVNIWAGVGQGHRATHDPTIVTVPFATREGIEILSADIIEGGLLVLKVKILPDVERLLSNDGL